AFRIVFLSGVCRHIKTGGRCRLKLRHSHCCPQPFVIPACAGMTIWKLPETQKKPKPNTLDSRFRGNDGGGGRCRLKPNKALNAV
ncbi:hypothetical protein, partial [Neisseria viridiae]|uniref:hypothetical protein n=1 Tax=Neisseria viridiae TaxID=2830648 RepID=UPI00272A7C10